MPWAAPRFCTKPGHPAFTGRRCPECERIWDRAAGSASARGYGKDWQRLRQRVLAEEPLCRLCHAEGRVTAATEVDHIEPLHLRPDLRLVRSNTRPICHPCHREVTRAFNRARAGGGRTNEGIRGSRPDARGAETAPPAAHATSPGMGFPRKGPSR